MPTPDLSIHLNLKTLRPTSERLRELVALFGEWGYTALYIEWGGGFPWTTDERFRGEGAYSEELVVGLKREAASRGIALNAVFPSPSSLDFAARIPAYHHLFRWEHSRPFLDLLSPAGRKFHGDLVEDFLALVPEPGEVMIDYPGGASTSKELGSLAEPFHERRVSVTLRFQERAEATGKRIEELSSLFDRFVIPVVGSPAKTASHLPADRVIRGARMFVERERSVVTKLLTAARRSSGDSSGQQLPPYLLSFQPPVASGRDDVRTGALQGSVELALMDIRSFARRVFGASQAGSAAVETGPGASGLAHSAADAVGDTTGALVLAGKLEENLESGWRCARAIREHLAEHSPTESCDPAFLHMMMALLDDRREEAQHLAGTLYERLSQKIDARALDRRLRAVIFPLFEEYHVLLPRVGHSQPPSPRRAE